MDELIEMLDRVVDHYKEIVSHSQRAELHTKFFNDATKELKEKFGLDLLHFLGGKIDGK